MNSLQGKKSTSGKRKDGLIKTLTTCRNIGERAPEHYSILVDEADRLNNDSSLLYLLEVLRVLGNKDRLMILFLLQKEDRCVCELECAIGKPQPTISRHLKQLEMIKFIRGWKDGKFTHYSLIKQEFRKFQHVLDNWMADVENWFEDIPKKL